MHVRGAGDAVVATGSFTATRLAVSQREAVWRACNCGEEKAEAEVREAEAKQDAISPINALFG